MQLVTAASSDEAMDGVRGRDGHERVRFSELASSRLSSPPSCTAWSVVWHALNFLEVVSVSFC